MHSLVFAALIQYRVKHCPEWLASNSHDKVMLSSNTRLLYGVLGTLFKDLLSETEEMNRKTNKQKMLQVSLTWQYFEV